MRVVRADPEDFPWLATRTGLAVTGEFRAIKAVDTNGRIHGMVGYDKWTHNAVRIHVVLDHPVRELIRPAFLYPFVEAGKEVLIGEIAESNRKSRRLAYRLGFHELARISDGWAKQDDLIIYTMRRNNCRWIRKGVEHELRSRGT